MMTLLAIVHVLACIALVVLTLMQDSKGGGMFASQSSSNSVLGATGGTTLIVKMTKIISALLLVTCLAFAVMYSKSQKSVIDSGVMGTATVPTTTIPEAGTQQTIPATAPAEVAPTAPAAGESK